MIETPIVDLAPLGPIGLVAIGAMAILMGEVFLTRARRNEYWIASVLCGIAIVSLLLAAWPAVSHFAAGTASVFNPSNPLFQLDRFSSLVIALLCVGSLLSCALAKDYLAAVRINHGEYFALVLLATSGMMLMVGAVDLLAVFLGLELMSIPIYVLAGFDRTKLRSNESAMKYFLIGSFASAVMLYGMALLYGVAGSTSFEGIRAGFDVASPMAMTGLGLVVVGFAFKISSVPFHQWTPDVYEGAPSAVTAFMSVTVKVAAFAALLRLLGLAFGPLDATLANALWVLAALTLIVGNVMATIQDNVKRLLAYSSIAHAGYLMIGIVAGTPEGYSAVVFYLVAYTFMNLGAFGVVVALAQGGRDCERIESFAGLAKTNPGLAALMTIFLISLAGIPGTVGFIGKFSIFMAAVNADVIALTIVGVLMSVVSIYYYLRIPVLMYMREPLPGAEGPSASTPELTVLILCAAAVIILGIFPNNGPALLGEIHLLDWTRDSVQLLFAPGTPVASAGG